jgi:hypothetical protein
MTDITNTNLEAAIIDQTVAGAFPDTTYAFVAVYEDAAWRLGVAIANERGYNPVGGKTFEREAEAREWADGLNEHIGLSADRAALIVISTMGGRQLRPSQLRPSEATR